MDCTFKTPSRDRQETDREIVLTIRIPKAKPPVAG